MKYIYMYIFVIILITSCAEKEVKPETVKDSIVVKDTIKETVNEIEEISEIIFTVQVAALKKDNTTFKSIENIQTYEEDGLTKYRLGSFTTYLGAREFRLSILKSYSGAFVQALKNGEPININQAL